MRKTYAGLARTLSKAPIEVRLFEPGRGRPRPRFVVRAENASAAALAELAVSDRSGRPVNAPARIASRRCDAASFLRGAFLARGSVSEPRSPAHLEFRFPSNGDASFSLRLLERLGVRATVRSHRGASVVTVKGVPDAGRLLAAMGAHRGYLAWEEGTVWKSVRGEANRLANCDTANARRTVLSALQQRRWIDALEAAGILERLTPALREAALLRREHPQAPIDELARFARPPVSKGAMADRLRRLGACAEPLVR